MPFGAALFLLLCVAYALAETPAPAKPSNYDLIAERIAYNLDGHTVKIAGIVRLDTIVPLGRPVRAGERVIFQTAVE